MSRFSSGLFVVALAGGCVDLAIKIDQPPAPQTEDDGGMDGGSDTAETAGASRCGNGVIDLGEQCDGINLAQLDCDHLGYDGGFLACDPVVCTFDTSMCMMPGGGDGGDGTSGTSGGGPGPGPQQDGDSGSDATTATTSDGDGSTGDDADGITTGTETTDGS